MAQTLLYLLPDFFGSSIYATGPLGGQRLLWLDHYQVSRDGLDEGLRMPSVGVSAGGMINNAAWSIPVFGYQTYTNFLRSILPSDWTLIVYPYDWRQGAQGLGTALGLQLLNTTVPAGGVRILGLGYGGLVACAAYGYLVDRGQANRVQRIVTIGAPLAGSYAPAQTWLFRPTPYNALSHARATIFAPIGLEGYPFGRQQRTVSIFTTWPSTYDMLPDPAMADDPGDTFRPQLWNPTTWADAVVPPKADLMQQSQAFRTWINNNRWPPPGVLVCGVGTGRYTGRRLVLPSPNGAATAERYKRGGLFRTGLISAGLRSVIASRILCPSIDDGYSASPVGNILNGQYLGDGIATPQSQSRPGVQWVSCPADHFTLPSDPVILKNMLAMLSGPGLPAGPLDAETLPDWPSYSPPGSLSVNAPVPPLPRDAW